MRRLLVTTGSALAAAALAAASVTAGIGGTAPAGAVEAPATARVRVAHFSPDAPGVDVYLDGQRVLTNVTFSTVSDYQTVPAGTHALALRPAGGDPSSKPVVSTSQTLAAGHAYTVAGVGPAASLSGQVFDDDLSDPPAGGAKVRVIHAAAGTGAVDVERVGGAALAANLGFGAASTYTVVAPDRYAIRVVDHSSGRELLSVPDVDVAAGITYSVVVIGGQGQPLQLLPIVDARGVEVLPAGAMRTGAGGTADRGGDVRWPWVAAGLAGVALVAVAVAGWRPLRRRLA